MRNGLLLLVTVRSSTQAAAKGKLVASLSRLTVARYAVIFGPFIGHSLGASVAKGVRHRLHLRCL